LFKQFGKRKTTSALAVLVAGVAAIGAYAFTASNTVPAHDAGVGVNTVTGYTVTTHPTYTYSADGTSIIDVTFQVDKAATDVAVALKDHGVAPVLADWLHCGPVAANTDLTCTFAAPVPIGATQQDLFVAAVDTGLVQIA
jgi:hypothetical protein